MHSVPVGSKLASLGTRLPGLVKRSTVQILKRPLQQFTYVLHLMGNQESCIYKQDDIVMRLYVFETENDLLRHILVEHGSSAMPGWFMFLNREQRDLSAKVIILGCTLFSHTTPDPQRRQARQLCPQTGRIESGFRRLAFEQHTGTDTHKSHVRLFDGRLSQSRLFHRRQYRR